MAAQSDARDERPGRRGAAPGAPAGATAANPPAANAPRVDELVDELADDAADPNTFERVSARTMLRLFCRDRVAVELALLSGWFPTDCADEAAAARREARAALPPDAVDAEVDAVAISLVWTDPVRWAGTDPGPNTWRVRVVGDGPDEVVGDGPDEGPSEGSINAPRATGPESPARTP